MLENFTSKSTFLTAALERGYVYRCTDLGRLDVMLTNNCSVAYVGFDCTADSLHVGNLIQIMLLRHLQQSGHKPIILMGGGTTRVGDPSGRNETRQLLTEEQISLNMSSIQTIFSRFLRFGEGPVDAVVINNAIWLNSLNYIAFLRDYGRYFSVSKMLRIDSIKSRLEKEQSLSFLEFNYLILQSYDFLELWRRTGCRLQIGGSDQWGNIILGIDLARRVSGVELFGLTSPLVVSANGSKMGKTASGAVWLNAKRLSPYHYWQFWRNTSDSDVGRYLRLFTDLSLDDIRGLDSLSGTARNEAKKRLAFEATRLAHGEEEACLAAETARKVFEDKRIGEALPVFSIPIASLAGGLGLLDTMQRVGFAYSNNAARRLIRSGGIRVNDTVVTNESHYLTVADVHDGLIKLSAGRKQHVVLHIKFE